MPDSRMLTVSADDLGLSKGSTDSILACVDAGVVTSVSVLPNGPAFEYAVAELSKRSVRPTLCAHLNLTEGRPLAPATDVPLLVSTSGTFKGAGHLARTYFFGSHEKRRLLRAQISHELLLQMRRVVDAGLSKQGLWVDGHQHVHMMPFVFEELVKLKQQLPIVHVRIPSEPFHVHLPFRYSLRHLLSHVLIGGYVLVCLGIYGKRVANQADIATNDWFVGVRYSGAMTKDPAQSGLRAVMAEDGMGEIEILFHPGVMDATESFEWSGNCAWYASPWRAKEQAYVLSGEAKKLFETFRMGLLPAGPNLDKTLRYIISGGLAAFTHLGALYLLTDSVGLWFVEANVLAFCFGLIVSFGMQKLWTFGDRRTDGVYHQAFWYALIQIVSLGVDTALLYILVTYAGWWYLGTQFLLLVLIAVGNFFLFNKVVFRNYGNS